MDVALHVLRCLKGTSTIGVFFSNSPSLALSAYCDSDWGACPDTRRSVSGFCIFLGESLISWKVKKQAVVSLSSADVEYRAISKVVAELAWTVHLLKDLHTSPVGLFVIITRLPYTLHTIILSFMSILK